MQVIDIARVCHEANRALCLSQGDSSQVHWEDVPEWQGMSAISGVAYRIQNPGCTAEDIHNNWLKDKVNDGSIYGVTKDPFSKQHPCLVPYTDLPQHQQLKDKLFGAIVDALK